MAPTTWFGAFSSPMHHDFPCNKQAKKTFCERCSNKTFNFETRSFSKIWKRRNNDPIVKLGSFSHNSLEYCICMTMRYHTNEGNGQLSKPKNHFVFIWNLGSAVFAWSILSWITHRNSSLDRTNFDL